MTDREQTRRDAEDVRSDAPKGSPEWLMAGHILALLTELKQADKIIEAAEALIERTVTDFAEVGRREVRLSALLHQRKVRS